MSEIINCYYIMLYDIFNYEWFVINGEKNIHFNSIEKWRQISILIDISKHIQPHVTIWTVISNLNEYLVKTYIWLSAKCVYPEYWIKMSLSVTMISIKRYREHDVDYIIRMIHYNLIDHYTHRT